MRRGTSACATAKLDEWVDDAEGGADYDRHIALQDCAREERALENAGFREGLAEGATAPDPLQAGFDGGYRAAAPLAYRVGMLRGMAAAIAALLQQRLATAAAAAAAAGGGGGAMGIPAVGGVPRLPGLFKAAGVVGDCGFEVGGELGIPLGALEFLPYGGTPPLFPLPFLEPHTTPRVRFLEAIQGSGGGSSVLGLWLRAALPGGGVDPLGVFIKHAPYHSQ